MENKTKPTDPQLEVNSLSMQKRKHVLKGGKTSNVKPAALAAPPMPFSPLDALIDCLHRVRNVGRAVPGDTVLTVNQRMADIFLPIVKRIQEQAVENYKASRKPEAMAASLDRQNWITCPICGSDYDGVKCLSCGHEKAGEMPEREKAAPLAPRWEQRAYELLAALDANVEWELAPQIKQLIHSLVEDFTGEPHTLTREQLVEKARKYFDRGAFAEDILGPSRNWLQTFEDMADFVLSLSPSTRPSGDGCDHIFSRQSGLCLRCDAVQPGEDSTRPSGEGS